MQKPNYELEEFESDEEDRIIGLMLNKGAMFASEIARSLGIGEDNARAVLNKMRAKELTEIIVPHPQDPQPLIRARIKEFWNMGIYGYGNFRTRTWFIPTLKAIQDYSEKHFGEHRRIIGAYFMTYPQLKHPEFERDEKIKEDDERPEQNPK